MKRWRKLVLAAMLAWLLLFLSVLSHFLDLRSAVAPRARSSGAAAGPSLSRTEIRRLASIQGGGGGGVRPGTPGSSSAPGGRDPDWGGGPRAPKVPRGEALLNGDPQEGRSDWAAGGLRAEGAKKKQPPGGPWVKGDPWSPEVDDDWEERRRRRKLRIRMKRARRRWRGRAAQRGENTAATEDEGEEEGDYMVSRSKAVVQKLWRGDASADMLSARLQKALKDYLSSNKHHVAYNGQRRPRQSGLQVLCELKRRARLRTLDGTEEPFASLGWTRLVPPRPLDQLLPQGSEFRTCAVVTSAGAILNSSLGAEIDSHDAVLRFNAAPTKGFEKDVGNRTTIRIINSQIVARPRHNFNSSSLYQDVTLVAWDPAPYSVDLPKWYENPDYDLFTPYSERRRRRPDQPFYILHPAFIWDLWDVIQANTQESIQPNPPSSGFIGILLMMSLCREVDVYEYIPSVRQTDLCHYHERYYDAACTLGAYHPLLYEKLLVQRMMSPGAEHDLKRKGKVTLSGFGAVDCSTADP